MKARLWSLLFLLAASASALAVSSGHPVDPRVGSSAPPTQTPIPVVTVSPLPTSSAAATPVGWTFVAGNGSIQAARKGAACTFTAGVPPAVGMALVSGTTYRIVIVCSNGGFVTTEVTFGS